MSNARKSTANRVSGFYATPEVVAQRTHRRNTCSGAVERYDRGTYMKMVTHNCKPESPKSERRGISITV